MTGLETKPSAYLLIPLISLHICTPMRPLPSPVGKMGRTANSWRTNTTPGTARVAACGWSLQAEEIPAAGVMWKRDPLQQLGPTMSLLKKT